MMSLEEWIHDLFENHQGWFLTALSSLMCIIGALIIYSDLLVKFIYPRSKFDIKSNEKFLICGFSLSSGSLLFTSFFKLLPKGLDYFNDATIKEPQEVQSIDSYGDKIKPSLSMMIYFFIGIFACELLNYGIHRFTSQSIIHCNHSGVEAEDHEHGHSHAHGHSHSHSSSSEEEEDKAAHHSHSHSNHHHGDEESLISNEAPHYGSSEETNPLIVQQTTVIQSDHNQEQPDPRPALIAQRKSFFDLALGKLTHRGSSQCIGIDDQDCEGVADCINEELTSNVSNDLHNLNFYRGLAVSKSKNSLVAYTTESPQSHNHSVQGGSGVIPVEVPIHPSNIRLTNEPNLDLHQQHKGDHHHQIQTPLSKLFSIGLQTCLALTLHKFPEGFITYATSAADPKLGVSIFLSLAIHNIVEGFSMTLPLYLALNSRVKAFGITFILGGLSQPIGALLAYYLIAGRDIDKQESSYVFGILMSITSGFLSVISLQLFASAINFGGSANRVIRWCLVGIFMIQLSNTLTDYNN